MKYILFVLLFCTKLSYGQEKNTKGILAFKPEFRLYGIIPNSFGDNYLSKANKPKIGIGMNFDCIELKHFQVGIGYEHINYTVTDITKAGNINNSVYTSLYGKMGYEIKLSNNFNLKPYLGIGSAKLKFKSEDRNFGHQDGTNYRIGFNTNYKLTQLISAFAGVSYIYSKYKINTSPEFVSFYDNSKTIQLNIGVKIN
ncbi:outer membrane beta-barrel protein [Flavobacterium flavipallidum]|uniref:Outer membrane beta-barrel protein n=1 Tax=Flavobacterium flavipallidum TaxID=3139140 RepID=A0ABU9HP43_9FLAO